MDYKKRLRLPKVNAGLMLVFYGGIIPGNADELLPLVEAGVRGFKGFLIESGVDEFPAVSFIRCSPCTQNSERYIHNSHVPRGNDPTKYRLPR
ncbi:hypothetical protein DID88_002490 [Monilinia fructigena]|uniref:Uncharacterized protein n=1 Tax=Monilinia fructigena TaxID=38457 RepID=A0A395IPD4_9HELO|nr:hypothetical protein DID88_002490 [Monilinia fructigena]